LAVHRVRAHGDNEPDHADQEEGAEEEEGDGDGDFAGGTRTATWAAIPPTPLAPCEARFHSVRDDTIGGRSMENGRSLDVPHAHPTPSFRDAQPGVTVT